VQLLECVHEPIPTEVTLTAYQQARLINGRTSDLVSTSWASTVKDSKVVLQKLRQNECRSVIKILPSIAMAMPMLSWKFPVTHLPLFPPPLTLSPWKKPWRKMISVKYTLKCALKWSLDPLPLFLMFLSSHHISRYKLYQTPPPSQQQNSPFITIVFMHTHYQCTYVRRN